ncbi:Hydrogen cyanide synthase subunit HcnC precursor [Pseudovibrio axinellae]|uniref:Hydrogen cyanide synthase subunit HcnC n=1 Tax=Pseudovibrio axinellae TaxID=989403 RepID=A0A166BCV8_9HYPH|nr:FAD-dependent oxidoreductase [Pseudovibrio axinellae]KZL22136.1 Hydrogen cyanide synthase subunit HcnC precursor [Pseudovibrio axinellae]SEQ53840.1 Glycine/D-amino acid oxidase [Pseudovibrio axinellae]
MTSCFDIAIVGGGIMGCASALRMAGGGLNCFLLEKGDLGQGASGVNAGTLSLQIKRVKLMPYAIAGHHRWAKMGEAVGFKRTGGYTLAFTQREAELLFERQKQKADAGAPIRFVSQAELQNAEPHLAHRVVAASYCPEDGYANSSLTGQYYRSKLQEADIPYREQCPVEAISRANGLFCLKTPQGTVEAKRLLLAAGAWLKPIASLLGVDLPVRARVNTVSVTERMPELTKSVIGHATGLLTMKQKSNGSILIGGGWQGKGSPQQGRGQVNAESLQSNLALAQYALPELARARILRSWTGFEANTPDFYPLAGPLPGIEDAYVLGCVRGGYTIGPYISELMGDFILGREPELPLFDPARSYSED